MVVSEEELLVEIGKEEAGLVPRSLVLDRGCFHGLSGSERTRCAEGVTAAAAPGAHLLLFAFQPRRLGVGPRGITSDELERAFAGWEVLSRDRDADVRLPPWLGNARPSWYVLRRKPEAVER